MPRRTVHHLMFLLVLTALLATSIAPASTVPSVVAAQSSVDMPHSQSMTAAHTARIDTHHAVASLAPALFAAQTNPITPTAQITTTVPITPTATPQPTVTPLPTATPVPASDAARLALAMVAQRENIPADTLEVINERPRPSALLSRDFQSVLVGEKRAPGRMFRVLVDLKQKQIEDPDAIAALENQAAHAIYGKFDPALYNRLQKLPNEARVTVMIWAATLSGKSEQATEQEINAALSARFPEVRAALARSGKPMDVENPGLARKIAAARRALRHAVNAQQTALLVPILRAAGATITTTQSLPVVFATLTKAEIQKLAKRPQVSAIALSEAVYVPQLDTAVASDRVPAVVARGYDGTGAKIAIVEGGNVDMDDINAGGQCEAGTHNCFRYPGAILTGTLRFRDNEHTTLVASAAASDNATYQGVAPGAEIISAGMREGGEAGVIDAVEYAFGQHADIANLSIGDCTDDGQLTAGDRGLDYLARAENKLVVVSAGNRATYDLLQPCPNDRVRSLANGWNVLTVGSYDDHRDADWANDTMAGSSQYINPDSPAHDREKPELVAPGENITGVGLNGEIISKSGTSFAAPQVAGTAALMINRNAALATWPEAIRAILMATATHNIDGPTGIPTNGTDYKDGVGGINADLADLTAKTRGDTTSTPANQCDDSCWWGETLTPDKFEAGTYRYYYFHGNAGDHVRVGISWWSQSNCTDVETACPVDGDTLSTALGIRLFAPDGSILSTSNSNDNNYELIPPDGELILPATGTYKIGVSKTSFTETANAIGVAWTKIPATADTYDDTSSWVWYGGAWTHNNQYCQAYNCTHSWTNVVGESTQLYFEGSRITYQYQKAYNRGSAHVFIDGIEVVGTPNGSIVGSPFSAYSPDIHWQQQVSWDVAPNQPHTIKVVAAGDGAPTNGYIDLDAFIVDGPAPLPSGPWIYDDTAPQIVYSVSPWTRNPNIPGPYNDTHVYTNLANASASFTFTGGSITYLYQKIYNRGSFKVYIDGAEVGGSPFSAYDPGPAVTWQVSQTWSVTPGTHTIKIVVVGDRHPDTPSWSPGGYGEVDAFIVGE